MSLIEMILKIAEENSAKRVLRVFVRVGELSGVVVDSLVFAFDALKEGDDRVKDTELVVERVPVRYRCGDCGRVFEVGPPFFAECPHCGGMGCEMVSGEELDLVNLEMEV